jgi:hypothetical protein
LVFDDRKRSLRQESPLVEVVGAVLPSNRCVVWSAASGFVSPLRELRGGIMTLFDYVLMMLLFVDVACIPWLVLLW